MPARSKADQQALEISYNLINLIKMVEIRTDHLLKHLSAGGYHETAELVHNAAAESRAANRRLLGEVQTAGKVVDAMTWEEWMEKASAKGALSTRAGGGTDE